MPQQVFRDELKELFVGYGGLTPKIRRGLQKLGGTVVRQTGRHNILLFVKDGQRHFVTISKTPSDKVRAGHKIISTIMHELCM